MTMWMARCGACRYTTTHEDRVTVLKRLRRHQERMGHHRPLGIVDTEERLRVSLQDDMERVIEEKA